jgi:hypothetical protein
MTKDQTRPGQAGRAKTTRRRAQARRKGWYVVIGFCCVLAAIVLLTANENFTAPWSSAAHSNNQTKTANSETAHTGTIVVQKGDLRCERAKFDNDTGAITDSFRCENENKVVLDAHGMPVPVATVHRLDTISKSFSGR